MSEYQYYEFCRITEPLSKEARKEMASLSSRANLGTHGVSYVYNYGDFRGDPEKLVLKYFDIFFYISNFGTIRLLFKYSTQQVEFEALQKYCIKYALSIKQHDDFVLLDIHINNENGFGWTESEGLLPELLPLYDEIKTKNYQFLQLVSVINDELTGANTDALDMFFTENQLLSSAQQAFIESVGIDHKVS